MASSATRCSVVVFDRQTKRDVRCENDDVHGRLIDLLNSSPMAMIFKRASGLRFVDDCGRTCPVCARHFVAGARNMLSSATSAYLMWMYERWIAAGFRSVAFTDANVRYVRAMGKTT